MYACGEIYPYPHMFLCKKFYTEHSRTEKRGALVAITKVMLTRSIGAAAARKELKNKFSTKDRKEESHADN